MTWRRAPWLVVMLLIVQALLAQSAAALPTMVRLGYADCAACHLSPQGGGPLNEYGRGIDQAQSLRGGEYRKSTDPIFAALTFGGRVTQDLRTVLQRSDTWTSGRSAVGLFRPRLMYRNVTNLSSTIRVAAVATAESTSAPRPALPYDASAHPSTLFVNTALVHVKVRATVELAAGRDQLPTGVNVPDLALFVRARNRGGYYDAPLQAKVFVNAKRFHLTPFGYHDAGNEPRADRERGAGTLAEFDLFGHGKTVAGISLLRGHSDSGDRRTVGTYARLGFGRWGVLAEHDATLRDRTLASGPMTLQQTASYGQLFWAVREWLVVSAIGERLRVAQPFEQKLNAGRLEVVARLASQATIGVSARVQQDQLTGRYARSIALQAAFKTVQ